MSRPEPLTTAADRRPAFEIRGEVSRSIGRASGDADSARGGDSRQRPLARTPGSGLTLRERRIQKILLKELEKLSQGSGLSYNERQKLLKTLDVDYIDAELAKMDKTDALMRTVRLWLMVPLAAAAAGVTIWALATGQPLDALFPALTPALLLVTHTLQIKANQRRRWIYEALRELSDADDMDVHLPESVALADLLIDRLVAEEDAASGVPLRRTRA